MDKKQISSKNYSFYKEDVELIKEALEIAANHYNSFCKEGVNKPNDTTYLSDKAIAFAKLNHRIKPISTQIRVYIPSKEEDC